MFSRFEPAQILDAVGSFRLVMIFDSINAPTRSLINKYPPWADDVEELPLLLFFAG